MTNVVWFLVWFAVIVSVFFAVALGYYPFMQWKTGNKWYPFLTEEDMYRAISGSGEPILHTDSDGRKYLKAKIGPDKFETWYIN